VLPVFDSFNRQTSYIEVFAEGTQLIKFTIDADKPWIMLTEDEMPRIDSRFPKYRLRKSAGWKFNR
jgi:hypothetical protein